MATFEKLREKAAALEKQIAQARQAEFDGTLAEVRKLVSLFGFSPGDVFGEPFVNRRLPEKRPKYRDPETGVEWSGLGRPPRWIKGKDREQFRME
jgi:DNA-binding protein H-NS